MVVVVVDHVDQVDFAQARASVNSAMVASTINEEQNHKTSKAANIYQCNNVSMPQ